MISWFRRWLFRPARLEAKLDTIEAKVDAINTNQESIMGVLEDLASAFDAETNAVAARLDELKVELATAVAANQAPDPATITKLQAVSDRLKSLGADPAQPIPPAPQAPPATP